MLRRNKRVGLCALKTSVGTFWSHDAHLRYKLLPTTSPWQLYLMINFSFLPHDSLYSLEFTYLFKFYVKAIKNTNAHQFIVCMAVALLLLSIFSVFYNNMLFWFKKKKGLLSIICSYHRMSQYLDVPPPAPQIYPSNEREGGKKLSPSGLDLIVICAFVSRQRAVGLATGTAPSRGTDPLILISSPLLIGRGRVDVVITAHKERFDRARWAKTTGYNIIALPFVLPK